MKIEELKITKKDLALWLDRPPSNDDLDLCAYLEKALENQHNYYQEIKQLQQENQQLKEKINKALNKINNMFDRGDGNTIIDDLLELEKILKGSDSNGI